MEKRVWQQLLQNRRKISQKRSTNEKELIMVNVEILNNNDDYDADVLSLKPILNSQKQIEDIGNLQSN